MQLPPEIEEALLSRWPVARLATLRRDGSAALVPVVFAPCAGALWSPVDAKPKRDAELARIRHVERDPRVTLLLDGWDADWSRLWWLRLDAEAAVVRSPDLETDPDPGLGKSPERGAVVAALRAKYPQYATTPLFCGTPTLLRIAVRARASWCAGPAAIPRAEGPAPSGDGAR